MNYVGDFAADETVYLNFASYDSNGASVTLTGLATSDIEIYKNGGTTQRSSDAGYTVSTDFDTITGIHAISIDTSNNTDAGFFAAGNDYVVIVSSVTIDSQTVSFVAGSFSIENRFMRGTDSAALAADLATVDTNVDAILVDTSTTIPAQITGLNDLSAAQVNAEVDTAIADAALATAASLATVDANVDAVLVDTGTTIPAQITGLNDLSAAQVNAEVDTAIADAALATAANLATVDTNVDAILVDTGTTIPAQISGLNDISAAAVNAEVDTALADYDGPTKAELDAGLAALNDPTAAAIADAVWDEVLTAATHNVSTSAGRRLRLISGIAQTDSAVNDPGAAATTTAFNTDLTEVDDFWNDAKLIFTSGALAAQTRIIVDYSQTNGQVTLEEALTSIPADNDEFVVVSDHIHPNSQIADAVWDEALLGHTTAGSAGKAVADIEADTNELQSDDVPGLIAALNNLSAAQVNAEVDTAIADAGLATSVALATVDAIVDAILVDTGTTIPGLIAALNDLSAAQVNAEVDTAIADAALATAANLATVDGIVDAILVDTATTIPALIAALNDLSAAQVNAEVDTALADYDGPTKAELDAGLAALNDPTAAAIADAVLDEATAGHTTAGTVGAAIVDILADTNELQADDVPGLIAALNNVSIADILQTQLTEDYAADGTAPTLTQAVMLIMQHLTEVELVGTTWTTKKLDGTTTAATFTTDDANDPTSITRTS